MLLAVQNVWKFGIFNQYSHSGLDATGRKKRTCGTWPEVRLV